LVQELRKDKTAPCDTAGAEALVLPPIDGEQNDELYAKTRRFQTLVALMLSSQTKDAMVERAMENLRATDGDGGGDGLTIASIMVMDPEVLNSKINMVGFHNNKTKYLKQVAEILHEKYDDDIPLTADEMIRNLPGIGPKMAYIIEPICWVCFRRYCSTDDYSSEYGILSSYDDALIIR
jgi:endonuclease-3